VHYEHNRSDENIHLDIKKLGRLEVVAYRITGNRSQRKRENGWDYLHVCVDNYSRLAYTEILAE
jgi:hypothetical protein